MWLLLVLLLALATPAAAGQLDASWTAPTTNTDGSPVSGPLTYRVYWVLFPQTPCPGTQFLVSNPGATSLHLASVTAGMTYNAQVTAVNTAGQESACSAMASAVARADAAVVDTTPPPTPGPPQIGTLVPGPSSVQIPLTWAVSIDQPGGLPVPTYLYTAAYGDGTGAVSGSVPTNAVTLRMTYHSSGLAQAGFVCIRAVDAAGNQSVDAACNALALPAKPSAALKPGTNLKLNFGP